MTEDRARILVIRGGAIGDFILTLPVLAALREQFPQVKLVLMGYPHIGELALAGGLADELWSIEARALAGFFARNNSNLDEELAARFDGVGLIVSYLYDPDDIFRENVGRCTRAQFISGAYRPSEAEQIPASELFLKALERLAIFDADPVPRLELRKDEGRAWPQGKWFAAHPGSGSERKNWPEKKWAKLFERLRTDPGLHLLLTGGEAEWERLERLAALWPEDRLKMARNLRLSELARLLSRCAVFVGHDSGISHLAGAVGVSGLILWGETNELIWAPRNPQMRLLKDVRGLEELEVDRVASEVKGLLQVAI
jgi:heptosyltransferase III